MSHTHSTIHNSFFLQSMV